MEQQQPVKIFWMQWLCYPDTTIVDPDNIPQPFEFQLKEGAKLIHSSMYTEAQFKIATNGMLQLQKNYTEFLESNQ